MSSIKCWPSKTRLNDGFLFLVCFLFLLPVTVVGGVRGTAPIDIVPSDLIAILVAITYFLANAPYSLREPLILVQVLFVVYCFTLASLTIMHSGSLLPLFSFVKFCKIYIAFFAGYAASKWYGRDRILTIMSDAAVAYFLLLAVSQFLYHADFTPRIGSDFFEFPVYGFPNSPSSYLVYLLCLALVKQRASWIKWLLLLLASIFAAGSLSRNALIQVVLAVMLITLDSPKKLLQSAGTMAIGLSILLVFDLYTVLGIENILTGIQIRLDGAQRSGDFSNGRFDIFLHTIDLISQKPLFGYGFQSFSNFAQHSTPHNQYLEVFFKTGALGIITYLSIIWLGISRVVTSSRTLKRGLSVKTIYIMFALMMLSNLAQPNLSYSVTGNLVFFILGLFAILPKHLPTSREKAIQADCSATQNL